MLQQNMDQTTQTQTPHLAVAHKAMERISFEQSQLEHLQSDIQKHQHELSVIDARQNQRSQLIGYTALEVQATGEQKSQARIDHSLKSISDEELEAIEMAYSEACKRHLKKIETVSKENRKDQATADKIQAELKHDQEQLQVHTQTLQRLQQAHAKAMEDHGQIEYQSLSFALQHLQEQRSAHVDAINALDEAKADILAESSDRLADFPEHLGAIVERFSEPYQDDVTRLLDADLAYRKALESFDRTLDFIQANGIDTRWLSVGYNNDPVPLNMRNEIIDTVEQFLKKYREGKRS